MIGALGEGGLWRQPGIGWRVAAHFIPVLGILFDGWSALPLLVFCWIALNEGGLQRDMCDALAIPVSTASRNVAALSEVHRLGKPGLGLVTWTESKQDRRAKLLGLTSTGKMFARSLLSAVDRA